jgi:hypothetical protein
MPQANSMEVQSVSAKRSAIGAVWRWRTELGSLTAGTAGYWECSRLVGLVPAGVAFGGSAVLAVALPWSRRWVAARCGCLLTRHRLQSVFWELRLHNRAFRIPLVLWIRPTPAGERAWIVVRAGLCADDLTNAAAEITAACIARDTRVTVSARFGALVTIDVLRRDVLGPARVIRSPLAGLPALADDSVTEGAAAGPAWPQTAWTGD